MYMGIVKSRRYGRARMCFRWAIQFYRRGCPPARLFFLASLLVIMLLPVTPCKGASPATEPSRQNAEVQSTEEEEGETEASSMALDGYVAAKYVSRTARPAQGSEIEEEGDEDLFAHLRVDAAFPRERRYEFHFLGLVRSDLDGEQSRQGFFPFEDTGDTNKSATAGYVFEAHFDVNHALAFLTQLLLGRQAGTRDELIFFDGLAADLHTFKPLRLTVYGGRAVHFFEVNGDAGSDSLAGLGIDLFPKSPTRVSLDYLSTEDQREPGRELKDRLVALKIKQRFSRHWRGLAKARNINGEQRDFKLRATGSFPKAGVGLNAAYFRQYRTQNELSQEFSPIFDILGQSHPFHSLDLKLRWAFATDYGIHLGYFRRELREEEDEGPFNRQYDRAFAIFDMDHFLFHRFSTALTAERWKSGAQSFESSGLDLGYRLGDGPSHARLNGGTYYSLYKYDYYADLGERTRVRTYYVKGKLPLDGGFSVNGAFEYEKTLEIYQTLKLGGRYDF